MGECFFWYRPTRVVPDHQRSLNGCVCVCVLKNDLSGFPKVKWLNLTGEVDKSVRCSCQFFSGFNIPKIIKIGQFLTELFNK